MKISTLVSAFAGVALGSVALTLPAQAQCYGCYGYGYSPAGAIFGAAVGAIAAGAAANVAAQQQPRYVVVPNERGARRNTARRAPAAKPRQQAARPARGADPFAASATTTPARYQ